MKSVIVQWLLFISLVLLALTITQPVVAAIKAVPTSDIQDGAFLDPKYPISIHALPPAPHTPIHILAAPKNDVESVIAKQTAVKSQVSRGTCSIFSATAMLETRLVTLKDFPIETDLSEEWLEYVTHLNSLEEGSSSWTNFAAFAKWGTATEVFWPYIGQEWESLDDSPLAQERCGDLDTLLLKPCLLGHQNPQFLKMPEEDLVVANPEFAQIRSNAFQLRDQFLGSMKPQAIQSISTQTAVKKLLFSGTPLTLDIDFYYGAWNHREATGFGLQRNMDHWYNGIVGFPEEGSKDVKVSLENPAGHSIVVVGYDDTVEVETEVAMEDGSIQKFVHTGVFYFKNSWGTGSFGNQFEINGVSHPGYGMITQDYAFKHGTFFQMLLK